MRATSRTRGKRSVCRRLRTAFAIGAKWHQLPSGKTTEGLHEQGRSCSLRMYVQSMNMPCHVLGTLLTENVMIPCAKDGDSHGRVCSTDEGEIVH